MAAMWKLSVIGIIIASLLAGFIFYYVTSLSAKKEKKKQAETILSLLINFVIFIWVGKIVLNIALFIKDPLVILAYPSDSKAFYFAILAICVQVAYKVKRKQLDGYLLVTSFIPIFLFGSLTYEFIQMVSLGDDIAFSYIVLLVFLVLLYLLLQGKTRWMTASFFVMFLWSIGKLLLLFFEPYTSVFGYMLHPIFYAVSAILFLSVLIREFKRRLI
ncbi:MULTISPECIES: hypothetical protein [unclassified Virgibacillus]|uniref:hypothetical protein n=1 Tax=unclassified Virgibacillus TaxID=2620237 RepID=UPI0024DE4998|nr:hypothetical protein [Virgibacillus sp. LDC-1]